MPARCVVSGREVAVLVVQPVVIEGKPGGDGIPALEAMLAAPAGEALLVANHGVVTVTPILHPRLGFDPLTALSPVVDLAADQFGVAVPAALPAQDLLRLVALARERPGALNWTSAPGPLYLAMRAFLRDAGLDMVHVGFRGVGAATVAEMLADRLQVVLAPLAPVAALAREGKLRVIAVTARRARPPCRRCRRAPSRVSPACGRRASTACSAGAGCRRGCGRG